MSMDLDPTLVEELQELSLERPVASFKSPEELERLTVDEHLTDIERAVYLLSSGQEVQRISVIDALPDLLSNHNEECLRRVVPKVREVLHVAQAEMQLAACKAFLQILQGKFVPLPNYTQTFLQSILMAIDSKDPDVANAWLETLLDVIDLLPKDVIKREILGIAIAKGQLSQTVQSRLSCCRILGKIATKFEPFVIRKDILPIVQSLCQDVDYEVRGCMCRQLDPVARGLGLDSTKNAILPELVELTNDEESYVRLAGLETVVNILSLLDDDTCTHTIIPLVCKFCQQALANEDSTLPMVAKELGKLCHGFSDNLTEEQRKWFTDYYKKLCKLGLSKGSKENHTEAQATPRPVSMFPGEILEEEDPSVECRKNAAYNFPAMVLFTGVRNFKSELYSTFSHLVTDPSHHVRKSVSCGFHEVAKLLGNNVQLLQEDLITLLRDDSIEVLRGVVSNLPETLHIMSRSGTNMPQEARQSLLSEYIPAMIQCDIVVSASNNWRLQAELIETMASVTHCFTSDQIYSKFVSLLFRKLHTARALPVRHAVIRTLLIFLRHNRKAEQRKEMCHRLIEECCHGQSFYQRTLFIDVCKVTMELFSRNFFKTFFFEPLLSLASDPVPNVRLRVCPLLPLLKAHIKLPSDRQLLQQLEMNVRKLLLNEQDRDVHAAIQKAVEELDKTQVQMESFWQYKLTKKAFLEDDIADQKKEEEERLLLEMEEKDRKEEEVKSAKGERKKDLSCRKDPSASKIPAPKKGSKIPTATSNTSSKEKGLGSASGRERNGAVAAGRDSKSSISRLDKATSGKTVRSTVRRDSDGSPRALQKAAAKDGNRKGSASSVSSTSSNSSAKSLRRGSTGTCSTDIPRRHSGAASGPSVVRKKSKS